MSGIDYFWQFVFSIVSSGAAVTLALRYLDVITQHRLTRELEDQKGRLEKDLEQYRGQIDKELEDHKNNLGKDLEEYKGRVEKELEEHRSALETARADRHAKRDYEYDARKRLYEECEPLLFQLMELAEVAYSRIKGLARTARDGDLRPDGNGWLSGPGYYLSSTAYRLLAVPAVFRILQRRVTLIDLSLDRRVRLGYGLMKLVSETLTDDYGLARESPEIEYDPDAEYVERKGRPEDPRYVRQGVFVGILERALDAIIHDADGASPRLLTFGEFEDYVRDENSKQFKALKPLLKILRGFHPASKPVLWRILIAQCHIYQGILCLRKHENLIDTEVITAATRIADVEARKFDWCLANDSNNPVNDCELPFRVAETYLKQPLDELLKDTRPRIAK